MMVAVPAVIVLALAWWLTGRLCSPGSVLQLLDHPNERSLHHVPTPRSGGLAIIASVVIGLVVAAFVAALARPATVLLPKGLASGSLWIIGSMVLVSVMSFLDDQIGLPSSLRFAVQAVAAVIVVGGVGLTIPSISIPRVGTIPLGWMAAPVSVVFLLWMTNLYNFMDGMDGFAGGMTTLGFGFLAYFGWKAEHPFMFLISTLVAMSALGFLVYNLPPARIFMGDVGSITLGFLGGTLILLGLRDGLFDLWVPIVVFSPFILDATVTVLRRAWQGEKIWEAHRSHYYQRLVLNGWGHRKTVLVEYGLMALCGVVAMLYQEVDDSWRLALLAVWIVVFVALAKGVHILERRISRELS
ncbi:MAG: MraY family glycosyltransferase [Nitrospiraceae bacterium]